MPPADRPSNPSDGRAFPSLADAAARAAARGIDIEQSYRAFQAEIRVKPPPALLRDLGLCPAYDELTIDRMGSGIWGWKLSSRHPRASGEDQREAA